MSECLYRWLACVCVLLCVCVRTHTSRARESCLPFQCVLGAAGVRQLAFDVLPPAARSVFMTVLANVNCLCVLAYVWLGACVVQLRACVSVSVIVHT